MLIPIFNKIYVTTILFYSTVSIFNFADLAYWPNEKLLNLTKYPPDNLGPGIIKFHFLIIPFFLLLLTSIILSLIFWRRGSSSSGYLCLSFLLPFLAIPIALITYTYLGGFNDFFWLLILKIGWKTQGGIFEGVLIFLIFRHFEKK